MNLSHLDLKLLGETVLLIFIYSEAAYPVWQLSLPFLLPRAANATLILAFSLFFLHHREERAKVIELKQ